MATTEEVKKLASLARITLTEEELEAFTKELDAILAYVGQLDSLELPKVGSVKPPLRNVMRTDGESHESGKYTERLVAQFPKAVENALEVKQIISHE